MMTYCMDCKREAGPLCVAYHDTRTTEQPRPEQAGECVDNCHFGDHDDYDIEQERIKFQKELGAAMVKAGAREIEIDAPAAPERGEYLAREDHKQRWEVAVKESDGSLRTIVGRLGFYEPEEQNARQFADTMNQHSALIAQRERLVRVLKAGLRAIDRACSNDTRAIQGETAWKAEMRAVITTIEQEGTEGR